MVWAEKFQWKYAVSFFLVQFDKEDDLMCQSTLEDGPVTTIDKQKTMEESDRRDRFNVLASFKFSGITIPVIRVHDLPDYDVSLIFFST